MMEFELSAKSGNAYTVQKKDNIMNNKKASGSQIDVALITTNRAGTLIRLTMTQKPETDSPLLVCSKIESTEDSSVTLILPFHRENFIMFMHMVLLTVSIPIRLQL